MFSKVLTNTGKMIHLSKRDQPVVTLKTLCGKEAVLMERKEHAELPLCEACGRKAENGGDPEGGD